ncbi:MAG: hypothetical protein EHM61_11770, partial [Acidobacteria bacterium]
GVEPAIEIAANRSADSLTLVPFNTPFMATMVSPLTGKLTRESDLYPRSGDAFVNPSTADRLAIANGQRVEIETSKGRLPARIRVDATAMPGLVFVPVTEAQLSSASTDPRNLCETSEDGLWRATPAKIRRSDV